MIKSKMNDTQSVLKQYENGKNLETRVSLYDKYSTNKQKYTSWVFENYDFKEGSNILEFGSGTGKDWKENIEVLSPTCRLTLSDFSQGMVDELTSKFNHLDNVKTQKIDIQSVQSEDASVDVTIANSMLYHVPDIDKGISEVYRVLKPSGTFYATTTGRKGMFQFLSETLHKISSDITMASSVSFTLQNGEGYLTKYFDDVNIIKYHNALAVTDTKDLVDFIYSVASIEGLKESHREDVMKYYEHLKNEDGIIQIDIEYGMFIAKK